MKHTIHKMATKPLLLALLLGATLLMASMARAQGRAPAVLPEMGLSIEEHKQVPPEQAKEFGFDFREKKSQTTLNSAPTEIKSQEVETSFALVTFAVVILAMPLFLWFALMRQLKRQRAEMQANAPISLEEFRARQEAKKSQEKVQEKTQGNTQKDKMPKAS